MVAIRLVAWLVGYVLFVALIVGALGQARRWALVELDRPAARAEWERWRTEEEARAAESEAPVVRRVPKSAEPPILVILRDNFVGVVASCVLMGSFLYAFFAIVGRGVWRERRR